MDEEWGHVAVIMVADGSVWVTDRLMPQEVAVAWAAAQEAVVVWAVAQEAVVVWVVAWVLVRALA